MNIFKQPKNNRKTTRGRKRQQVMSGPARIVAGESKDRNGNVKRWYIKNPVAPHVVKTIIHVRPTAI